MKKSERVSERTAPGRLSKSAIVRYAFAVASVAVAVAAGCLLNYLGLDETVFAVFMFAIAAASWFSGTVPAIVALVLATFSFNFFFTPPLYGFAFTRTDLAYSAAFLLFAGIAIASDTMRRRAEAAVRQSRDELELKVLERTAELKASEEMLRERANLLDLTHDTIFVRRMDNVITYWNRGAKELYGWSSHEALGIPSHELLQTEFPKPLEQINAKLLQTNRWEGELVHATRDGRRLVVSSRWSLQRDERGEPFAILETNTDITERRHAEEALRQSRDELEVKVKQRTAQLSKANDELQSVNKELEAFAYSVSHDLRAPVRHIAGFGELLQKHARDALDESSRRHLGLILDSAKRMGTLVDDLLAFSRIGRAETQKTTVKLDQLVKAVVADSAPDAQGRTIDWKIGELPICHGDPAMLRLVVTNLISNALKFTRTREQARIEIGSLNHRPGEVVFFVKDNGVGFDMKYEDKLFGVFQRLHSQEAFEGTGIGLATVQRIVHRHGGRVWAEGAIDQGATFYVALPATKGKL
jgi:PAS domain S-box-containing protein